jgi:hypothetical protein
MTFGISDLLSALWTDAGVVCLKREVGFAVSCGLSAVRASDGFIVVVSARRETEMLSDVVGKLKRAQLSEQASLAVPTAAPLASPSLAHRIRVMPGGVVASVSAPHMEEEGKPAKLRRDVSALRRERGTGSVDRRLAREGTATMNRMLVRDFVRDGALKHPLRSEEPPDVTVAAGDASSALLGSRSSPALHPGHKVAIGASARHEHPNGASISALVSGASSAKVPFESTVWRTFRRDVSGPGGHGAAALLRTPSPSQPYGAHDRAQTASGATGASPRHVHQLAEAPHLRSSIKSHLPALEPANRSDAIRLHELLNTLLNPEQGGGWVRAHAPPPPKERGTNPLVNAKERSARLPLAGTLM